MSRIIKALEKAETVDRRADRNAEGPDEDSFWFAGPSCPVPEYKPLPQEGYEEPRVNIAVHYEKTPIRQACFHKMEERKLLGPHAQQELRDAFNVVRTKLLQQTRSKNLNTVMVTSPGREEGKTTVATNLAITISREASQTALLVDANLRWPGISCNLGLESPIGLTDHLLAGLPLAEVLVNPGMEKLVILPAGDLQEDSADILASPKMQELVVEMKRRYPDRYVIFDCPHLLGIPDALVFTEYVDGIVLVVDEGRTDRNDLKTALGMLEGRNLLGIVLNNTSGAS